MKALNDDALRARLTGPVHYHAEVTSTNDVAMQLAREGAPAGTLVCADFQRAGRGRRGAAWTAPAGTSVLASLLLRPGKTLPASHLAILTGVGLANGLRAEDIAAQIKWPNDLMVRNRKVAGILVETAADAVVVGFGINCAIPEEAFPPALRDRAGSLHALLERDISREAILAAAVAGLLDAVARVEAGGIIKVLLEWNAMNWLRRREVRVTGPLGAVEGDGLFLDGHKLVFHVFKDGGVVHMPLASTVEAR
ncbi:MAG TPA: biotin--[acetyl-CoA-carboxylase] ligase [Armatimonadota bacterium]|nr:biotin--[acetyl-CoA-carboxylase] ligase [Armatimonadota bacterium]